MSRTELYERCAAEMIDDAVSRLRNRGLTRQAAMQECAGWLGMKARRLHALLFGEPTRVDETELANIRDQYIALLDADARDLERRAAMTRAKLQELRGIENAEIQASLLAARGRTVPDGG